MSGRNFRKAPQIVTPVATHLGSWPAYPSHGPAPLSDLGLFLYMTFEDGYGDDWWPLDDESAVPMRVLDRTSASRRRFRRSGR